MRLAESLKALDKDFLDIGAVQIDAAVKDGGMMLLTAVSPGLQWIQGNADVTVQVLTIFLTRYIFLVCSYFLST